jgi:hypothetical protein
VLVVGGAVLLLFALLSLSHPGVVLGQKRIFHTMLGAVGVAAVVFVLVRMGFAWAAVGLVFLWSAAKRLGARDASAGSQARGRQSAPRDAQPRIPVRAGRMTRTEAYSVLGLEEGATKERVLAEYRRLMLRVHPDQGGTNYLATRLNEAKDVLLG